MLSATIAHGIGLSGRGLFSGAHCVCKVRPALTPEECERSYIRFDHLRSTEQFAAHGILIEQEGHRYQALPERYLELPNCTALLPPEEGGPPLMVTEHLFAALWAAGIDCCRIVVQDGLEIPNHDGGALSLYEPIAEAGTLGLGRRPSLSLSAPLEVRDDNGAFIRIEPDEELSIDYSFSHPELGEQHFVFKDLTRDLAVSQILPARTFITQREGEALSAAGLLKNTHSEDALVLRPGADGSMQPDSPLRFVDEFARHKVLDLIGDLYIVPAEWTGRVTAVRSGHRLNRLLAREMMKLL